MLLGVAQLMSRRRATLPGEVRFVFQHAEEKPPGGAVELVEAGVLDGVDAVVGAHLMSILDTGQIAVLPGPELAAADLFEITVHGKGGHGALPQETVDPIVTAAHLVTVLQTLVSRRVDPLDPAVVTVGSIHGGTKHNVIPDQVALQLTVRSFTEEVRRTLLDGIKQMTADVCATFRCPRPPLVVVKDEYTPAAYNDPALTADATSVPCDRAVIVLRWDEGRQRYYVLTSYPEANR